MSVRASQAVWEGDLKQGQGTMTVGRGDWQGPYSFASRFEQGPGTNPKELIAAAHAGCFSMALANGLARAGFAPTRIQTTASVHLENTAQGFQITKIDLDAEARVPGIDENTFQQQADAAKRNCPVSKLLAAAEITLNAKLMS